MKNFALIGASGFIAPRHLKAIKDTGNSLQAALDPFDSVGILDSYFPDSAFFTESERFDRHLDKIRRTNSSPIDFVSICSPNYLHDAHIRLALRNGANAICEKPLVLNPWNVDALSEIERESGKRIYTILQLRHHDAVRMLKAQVSEAPKDKTFDVDLTYITSRGLWYGRSWKGNVEKSGGIGTNIGIHFFDMLCWIFGDVRESVVHLSEAGTASGFLCLQKARVRWFLSVERDNLPDHVRELGKTTYRSLTLDGSEFEFSEGFTELHTVSYKSILSGYGFGLEDARKSIELAHVIRNAEAVGLRGDYHPFLLENKRKVVNINSGR
ncbi:MAG TPA: Gfo/Idh/MocA family oxidoreductase [Oligoflexia bacterium]|nr:Gfo/Idh/MocA family oxidoreductase [Oligoflexia bacterium]HMP48550.1 Gfo/Idh/MocA family oxidoreductase [Oligoflexia bacterium]